MRPFLAVLLLAAALLPVPLRAQAAPPPAEGARPSAESRAPSADSMATLVPGDVVRIAVWRRPELSGDFVVAPDGTIAHPLYHEIHVAGVPLPEVETRLRTFLGRLETNPAFIVLPLFRVFVGGEVRQPSAVTVPPGTTMMQALISAGGPTEQAKLGAAKLLRDATMRTLDLGTPGSPDAQLPVHSGDQILVPRRRNFFRDVMAPTSSVIAAAAAVVTLIVQLQR